MCINQAIIMTSLKTCAKLINTQLQGLTLSAPSLLIFYSSLSFLITIHIIEPDSIQICTGIIIGNGETVCDLNYLRSAGVTHVLNTAEQHVMVSQARLAAHGLQYYGFHVDDLPHCNISR